MPHGVAEARGLFDREILRSSVIGAFRKLDPRVQIKNPVMFVVLVGSVITLIYSIRTPGLFDWSITIWLVLTVLFANFAEAMAEGRGKAQADTLRRMRSETEARLLGADGTERRVAAAELAKGRHGGLRGRRHHPLRRRDRRGRGVGGRVGHHRGVGPGDPGVGRGPLGGHRGHPGALRPHRGADHRRARPHLPRSHDQPGGRSQPAEDAQRGRPHHPVGRAHHRLHPRGGGAPALRPLCRGHRFRGRLGVAAGVPHPDHHRGAAVRHRHRRHGPPGPAQRAGHERSSRGGGGRRADPVARQDRHHHLGQPDGVELLSGARSRGARRGRGRPAGVVWPTRLRRADPSWCWPRSASTSGSAR